jgi:CRISPR-associated protein Csd2
MGFEGQCVYLSLNEDLDKLKKKVEKLKDISDASKAKLKELFVDSRDILAKKWMCKNFYDVRTFGAVMTTGDKTCGQVRGPVQLEFAKSISPIMPMDIAMSRTAAVKVDKPEDKGLGARKIIVPYGLYRVHGFISSPFAERTGFSEADLDLFWQALENMFEHDHSAARGKMSARRLIVFKHDSKLGNAPAHKLFDTVKVTRKNDSNTPARSYNDYVVEIDKSAVPNGVQVEDKF